MGNPLRRLFHDLSVRRELVVSSPATATGEAAPTATSRTVAAAPTAATGEAAAPTAARAVTAATTATGVPATVRSAATAPTAPATASTGGRVGDDCRRGVRAASAP